MISAEAAAAEGHEHAGAGSLSNPRKTIFLE
jgi:hypothetical protein